MATAETAMLATATGQAAVAAGNVGIATTASGAAAAMTALVAASGPFILVGAAIALAVANVVFWYKRWTAASAEAEEQATRLLKVADQIGDINFSFAGTLRDAAGDLIPLNEQLELTKQSIADIESRRSRIPTRQSGEGAQEFSVRVKQRELRINSELLAEVSKVAQAGLAQNQAKREGLEISEKQLAIATQQAQKESEREQSLRAQLGSLDAAGKSQLDNLLKQIEAGKTLKDLTDFQLRQLGQLGGGTVAPEVLEEQARRGGAFADRARAAGFTGGVVTEARDRLASIEDAITSGRTNVTASEALAAGIKTLNESDAEIKEAIVAQLTELSERNRDITEQLRQIRDNNTALAENLTP